MKTWARDRHSSPWTFFNKSQVSVADFTSFAQNFTLTRCSTLTLNMIPTENKNTLHFQQRLLTNCLPHDLEIVTVNGGESTSQYHTLLAVSQVYREAEKIKSGYIIPTPRVFRHITPTTCVNVWLSMPWRHTEGWRYRGVAPLDGSEWITSSPSRFAPWKERRFAWKKRLGGPKIRFGRFGEANNYLLGDWFSWKFVCKTFKPRTSWLTTIINWNVAGERTLDAVCYWCMVLLVYSMTCGNRICKKICPLMRQCFRCLRRIVKSYN